MQIFQQAALRPVARMIAALVFFGAARVHSAPAARAYRSRRRGPLKRTSPLRAHMKIRLAGRSETADTKREIQRLLREIVILRDGGCILRDVTIYGFPGCNGYTNSCKRITS